MPSPTAEVSASPSAPPPSATPALASAKIGSTTYDDSGCSAVWSRSTTGTDSLSRKRSRLSSSGSRCRSASARWA